MLAASKSKEFAKDVGIDQKVAAEFVEADRKAGLWQDEDKVDTLSGSYHGANITPVQ